MHNIIFVNQRNKQQCTEKVLNWLSSDFEKRGRPSNHFWYNQNVIAEAFDNCNAMIVLNEKEDVIGYMIWSIYGCRAEIVTVEVGEKYRGKGFCKKMLAEFNKKFTDVSVLIASVLEQSKKIFSKMDWKYVLDINQQQKFYKIVRPVLQPLDILPNDGCAIAILSQENAVNAEERLDFYVIQGKRDEYKGRMKYFRINLDKDHKLHMPIATPFHYEGYIGVYFNGILITEGKAKHLFENIAVTYFGLLILDKIEPKNPGLFNEKGFFSQLEPREKQSRKRKRDTQGVRFFEPEAILAKSEQVEVPAEKRVKTYRKS